MKRRTRSLAMATAAVLLAAIAWPARGQTCDTIVSRTAQFDPVNWLAAGTDPSYSAVPGDMRLATRALTSTVERSTLIVPVARASMLDGSLFLAGSVRWDAPLTPDRRCAVVMVGARLRLLSANGSIGCTRVEVGYPIAANGSVVHRPLLSEHQSSSSAAVNPSARIDGRS